LHRLHESDDHFVIDLDARSLWIQSFNYSNSLIKVRLRRAG
jgi:hypothetical protein